MDDDEDFFPDMNLVLDDDDEDDEPIITRSKVTVPPPPARSTRPQVVAVPPRRKQQLILPDFVRVENDKTIVSHSAWLSSQEFNDDLKFVNYDLIDFEGLGVVIEQDRTLGKGGHVWDGSFVLAENLTKAYDRVLELGAGGTGLAGLVYAKKYPDSSVVLSEGDDRLLPLLRRNISRNVSESDRCEARRILWRRATLNDEDDDRYWMPPDDEKEAVNDEEKFDLILAAECIAPIYDPQAFVDTLTRFSHDQTEILLLGKDGRWPEHAKDVYDRVISKQFHICSLEQPDSVLTAPYYKLAVLKPRQLDR